MAPSLYLKMLLACIAGGMLAVICFNFLIDPLQFYRRAHYRPYYSLEQRYQVPALIRTHAFRSIVVGNSQANAFRGSDLAAMEQFPEAMPLTLNGSTPFEQNRVAEFALATGKPRTVLWVFSDFSFSWDGAVDASAQTDGLADALYGSSAWAGLPYLASQSILVSSLRVTFSTLLGVPNYETFRAQDLNQFQLPVLPAGGLAATRPSACYPIAGEVPDRPASQIVRDRITRYVERVVAAHPQKLFYLVISPIPLSSYSYYLACDREALAHKLGIDAYLGERLTPYKNVRLYDFRTFHHLARDEGFVDFRHFTPEVAAEMLSMLARDEGRLVPETVASQRAKILELAATAPPFEK